VDVPSFNPSSYLEYGPIENVRIIRKHMYRSLSPFPRRGAELPSPPLCAQACTSLALGCDISRTLPPATSCGARHVCLVRRARADPRSFVNWLSSPAFQECFPGAVVGRRCVVDGIGNGRRWSIPIFLRRQIFGKRLWSRSSKLWPVTGGSRTSSKATSGCVEALKWLYALDHGEASPK